MQNAMIYRYLFEMYKEYNIQILKSSKNNTNFANRKSKIKNQK